MGGKASDLISSCLWVSSRLKEVSFGLEAFDGEFDLDFFGSGRREGSEAGAARLLHVLLEGPVGLGAGVRTEVSLGKVGTMLNPDNFDRIG